VKSDFEMYSPLVKSGGLIALHDICIDPDPSCKVNDYWNEIKDRYDSREIVKDPDQGWAGIGVIFT
jgi:predicted O-methyltransferase YrrM